MYKSFVMSVFFYFQFNKYPPPADEGLSDCFDTHLKPNPLHYYKNYSYSACIVECKAAYVINKCGCRDLLQPGMKTLPSIYNVFM